MSFKTGIGKNYIATNSKPLFTMGLAVSTVDQPNAVNTKAIGAQTKDLFTNPVCPQTVAFFGSYTLTPGNIPSITDFPGISGNNCNQASYIAVNNNGVGTLGIDLLAARGGGSQVGFQIIGSGTFAYVTAVTITPNTPATVPINIPTNPVPINCTFLFTQ